MTDIASLGLSIDSSQATTASAALDKLTASGQAATTAANNLSAASTKSATASTGHAAALNAAGSAANAANTELGHLGEIAAVLEARMSDLNGSTGLFGQILAALGPGALAAGAGIGAILVVIDQLVSSANRLGDFAVQLQNIGTVAGLSSVNVQALDMAGAQLGVSASTTNEYLQRFTEQLTQLKMGSGDLYTQLLKVSPALLAQISTAKSSADAINLLAAAYAKAGANQNALANAAAGGRNGAQFGLVLSQVAGAGSVDGVTKSVDQLDLITNQQTKDWATLKAQIDDTSENARNNIASIFTGSVLSAEKSFFDGWLSWTQGLKEFADSDAFKAIMAFMALRAAVSNATLVPTRSAPPPNMANFQSPQQNYGSFQGNNAAPTLNADGSTVPAPAPTLAIQATQAAAALSFLGSAATATDRYNASVLKLNASVANDSTLTSLQGRAMAGLSLDRLVSQNSTYIGALGDLATTTDLVRTKSLSLQQAQVQGAGLTKDQVAAIKNEVAANNDWSRASQESQLGVFNLSTAQTALNEQMQNAIDKKLLDPTNLTQMAAASQAAANKLQSLSDAAKVAGSATPQLTQLANAAGNVNTQFDTAATTSLNDFSDALVAIGTGASSASAAFQNFGLQVLSALEKMIVQLTIIKPLASGLESAFGGSGSWLSALGLGGSNALAAGSTIPGAIGATSVGGAPLIFAAAGGGTFGPGWGVVGEEGPELINVHGGGVTVIPNNISKPYLPGFAAGGNLTAGGNVSRLPGGQDNSPSVTIVNNNSFSGSDPGSEARMRQYVDQSSKQAVSQAVQAVAQIKSTTPSYLRAAR